MTQSNMCQNNTGSDDREFREVDLEVEYHTRVPTKVGKSTSGGQLTDHGGREQCAGNAIKRRFNQSSIFAGPGDSGVT